MRLRTLALATPLLLLTNCAPASDAGAGKTRALLPAAAITLGAAAPDGGIVLLDDSGDLSQWRHEKAPAEPIRWHCADGVLTIVPDTGSLVTKENVTDFRLHLEFKVNDATADGGKPSGNSGIYIQRRYELQILDPASDAKSKSGPGAIYKFKAPDAEAALPAGQWQSYDLVFRAARWDGDVKTQNARLTVHLNGKLIHDDVAIPDKTGAGRAESPEPQPLKLQDHGNAVHFRNIWMLPLKL